VLENAIDVLRKREELKAKRNLLFARFLRILWILSWP
jgi:hypothetical protein